MVTPRDLFTKHSNALNNIVDVYNTAPKKNKKKAVARKVNSISHKVCLQVSFWLTHKAIHLKSTSKYK